MGQEISKHAWPIPAGGYEALTGRRGRRQHSHVLFRHKHQHNEDYERLELECVRRENFLVSSGLLDESLLENTGMGEPVRRSVSRQTSEVNTLGSQNSGNFVNPYEKSEDLAEVISGWRNDLSSQNAIAYVNIDSYEPDSSDGEEDDAQDQFSLAREATAVFQETLDNMLSDLLKDSMPFSDLQSQLSALNHSISRECCEEAGPMPLMRYFSTDSDLACSNNKIFKSSTEDQARLKSNLRGANYETQRIKKVDVGTGTPVVIANELNVSGREAEQGNSAELVVRPKIRKQNTANRLERDKLLPSVDEEESGSWRITEIAEVQCHAECPLRNSKGEMSSSMFFDSREYDGHRRNTEIGLNKNAAAQERKSVLDKTTSCDEFKDCRRHFSMFLKDEDSSECSDGECSAAVPACFTATEAYRFFCDKRWETIPPSEDCASEVQSSSSSSEEEYTDICSKGWNESNVLEQTLLEEGEIPCLRYQEEVESSTDEEETTLRGFLHHGFFVIDGSNNFEDFTSLGEDLDVEWRLLDDSSDGLEFAQFFAPETPEGRLQTVETTLAHLQSFGFVEQAPPPAAKETIDCLPQVVITDDRDGVGQEQCTICWSEFGKGEIITELPCHHFFHKPCVTLWLQKSGTCPLCRHVLAPVLPEAAAATVSFLSDGDSASSVHNATGGSN